MVNFEDILKQPPEDTASQAMEFVLAPPEPIKPIEEPSPIEPEEPPPPKHMEDDIAKANTSDGLAESSGKQTPKPKGQDTPELSEAEAQSSADAPELLSSTLSDLLQQAIKNIELEKADDSKDKKQMGEQLNDPDNQGKNIHRVESLLDKMEEEKARWRNMVLKRISEQIKFVWVKPDGTSKADSGVIRLDIDAEGYLKSAWVHLPSGDSLLDSSVLRAIRSVWHFQIPKSDKLSRYYRHLEFHYRGGKDTS